MIRNKSPRNYRSTNFERLLGILVRSSDKFLLALEVKQLMFGSDAAPSPPDTRQIQKRFNKVVTNAVRHGWVTQGKADLSNAPTLRITRVGLEMLRMWRAPLRLPNTMRITAPEPPNNPNQPELGVHCPICGDEYPASLFEDLSRRAVKEFKCACGAKLGALITTINDAKG